MVLIILLAAFDVVFFLLMDKPGKMEKPRKKAGGWLFFFGFLLIAMGIGGFILKKNDMPQLKLNPNIESEWRQMLLDLLLITNSLLTEVKAFTTEYATALLINGAILFVMAIAKKIIRTKQIKSWENRLDLDVGWYGFQRFLVVLLPTLSTCFLTNAFVKHLTGIENATKIILESGWWGVSVTKDFVYRDSVSIGILNYFCTLGLMMYWRRICLIPKSSDDKIRMSLILLPCIFPLNYVLVRAFYGAVAAFLPPVMLVIAICEVCCIAYVIQLLLSPALELLSALGIPRSEWAMQEALRGIEYCRQDGDLAGINRYASIFTSEERRTIASYYRSAGAACEVCEVIERGY